MTFSWYFFRFANYSVNKQSAVGSLQKKHIRLVIFFQTKSSNSVEIRWNIHQQNINLNFFHIQILIAVSTIPSSYAAFLIRPGIHKRSPDEYVFFCQLPVPLLKEALRVKTQLTKPTTYFSSFTSQSTYISNIYIYIPNKV